MSKGSWHFVFIAKCACTAVSVSVFSAPVFSRELCRFVRREGTENEWDELHEGIEESGASRFFFHPCKEDPVHRCARFFVHLENVQCGFCF